MTRPRDEIDDTLEPGREHATGDQAEQQDFAARNVAMSNALPGGAQPAAGAVIGSGGSLGMEPETTEERNPDFVDDLEDEDDDTSEGTSDDTSEDTSDDSPDPAV